MKPSINISRTRPLNDKKQYHYVTLTNGLECLLISAADEVDNNRASIRSGYSAIRERWVKDDEESLGRQSLFNEAQLGLNSDPGPRKNTNTLTSLTMHRGEDAHRRHSAFTQKIKRSSVILRRNKITERKASIIPPQQNVSVRASRKLSTTSFGIRDLLEAEASERLEKNKRQSVVLDNMAISKSKNGQVQMAAISMAVGVGSFAEARETDEFQGLAHFLEHMLFMGSKKYRVENAFDQFLARIGGTSNAYTDSERTVYHFTCPQDKLQEALDIFAQFFIAPTLDPGAAMREVMSIEEEFTLRQNDDDCRLLELWRYTSRKETPFSRFTCGNRSTLGEKETQGRVFQKLKEFHQKYYVGSNMRLVVQGTDSVEDLQNLVASKFAAIRGPGKPEYICPDFSTTGVPWRVGDREALDLLVRPEKIWREIIRLDDDVALEEPLAAGQEGAALACVFRTIPLHDTHELSMTWQLPPQAKNKHSRPTDYVTFLLGHEADGSILSETKARGWTTGLYASACTMDGFEDNTACTMLNLTLVLTRQGLRQWVYVAGMVFEYIGILLKTKPKKWIMDELVSVYRAQYNYAEELDAATRTQDLSVNMLPQWGYAPENILDLGLMEDLEWRPDMIKEILYQLQPTLVRVDLSSTMYKADERDKMKVSESSDEFDVLNKPILEDPLVEPYTNMSYWVDRTPKNVLNIWRDLYLGSLSVNVQKEEAFAERVENSMEITSKRRLSLPPRNKYIATDFAIKHQEKSVNRGTHVLDGLTLTLRQPGAQKKEDRTRQARIVGSLDDRRFILVKYNTGLLKWHKLPEDFFSSFDTTTRSFDRTKTTMSSTKSSRSTSSKIMATLGKNRSAITMYLDDGAIPFSINPQTDDAEKDKDKDKDIGKGEGPRVLKLVKHKEKEKKRRPRMGRRGDVGGDKAASLLPSPMRPLEQIHARVSTIGFPYLPEGTDAAIPVQILGSDDLVSVWHLDNPNVSSPRSEVHARIVSPNVASSARNGALNDLLSLLVTECLRPEAFLARVAELDVTIESFDFGQNLKMSGFSDKMPDLLEVVFKRFVSFAVAGRKLHDKAKLHMDELVSEPVFYAQLESLGLAYFNEGAQFQSSGALSSALYRVLVELSVHPEDKAYAAEKIRRRDLAEFAYKLLKKCKVELLITGNLDDTDAAKILASTKKLFSTIGAKALDASEIPQYTMLEIPAAQRRTDQDPWNALSGIVHPLEALEFPGHSIDLFYFVGDDTPKDRIVLMLIEHIMREPIYAQLRTKKQLGYMVKCSTVVLHGKLGYVIELTSGKYGPQFLARDVDKFLIGFRRFLLELPRDAFDDHVCALARKKMENPDNLAQTGERHWETIKSSLNQGNVKYQWNPHVEESRLLASYVTPEIVLKAYDKWISPDSDQRRRVSVVVFGHGHEGDPLNELRTRSDFITFLSGTENEDGSKKKCVIS